MAIIDISPSVYWALAPLAGWPERGRAQRQLGTIGGLAAKFLAWRARRETVRLLNRVDCATLRDLGIIESHVYGDPNDRIRGYDANWWQRR
jgi:uncharacterized protein YjiS (DUF1127 family)